MPEGKLELSIPAEPCGIKFVSFTADGERLLTLASSDNRSFRHARVWDRRSGYLLQTLNMLEDFPQPAALHPVSGELVVAGYGITSFDIARPVPRWTMQGSFVAPQAEFWGADDILLSLSTDGEAPVCLQLRPEGSPLRLWRAVENSSHYLAVSPDARLAFVGLDAKNAVLLGRVDELVASQKRFKFTNSVSFVCFAPSSERVWTGRHVVDIATGRIQHPLAIPSPGYLIRALWPSPDSVMGIFDDGLTGRIVRCHTNGTVLVRVEHPARIYALVASPDGQLVAEAGQDKIVRLRDPASLEVVRRFRAHDAAITALAFHPRQPWIATVSDDLFLRVWDHRTGRMLKELQGPTSVLQNIAWSPGGNRIVATSKDRRVRVWEIELPDALPR